MKYCVHRTQVGDTSGVACINEVNFTTTYLSNREVFDRTAKDFRIQKIPDEHPRHSVLMCRAFTS
jgi:hypothetical protein